MYGQPFIKWDNHYEKDKIIEIKAEKLRGNENGYLYVWGWPGPDCNFYAFKDRGITWGYSREEIKDITYEEWKRYRNEKI